MTLAHVAHRYAKARPTMYHATGPAVPAAAGARVRAYAQQYGWALVVLDAGEFSDARYRANPVDRCYYCKSNLYARIREQTADPIASGTNCDDLSDFRPGLRAAAEAGVFHPYVEAGIDKSGIYSLAAGLGLSDLAQLPAQPCLASRVETGIAIAADDLAFIDVVERGLADALGQESVLRCRVTHAGVVIELGDARNPAKTALAGEIGEAACHAHGRTFVGVRPYRQGSAFVQVGGSSNPGDAQASLVASVAAAPVAHCGSK
jgi:uncharacterized protein